MQNEKTTRSPSKNGLELASQTLGRLLPPEASRILFSFQKIQLAYHYADTGTDDGRYRAWRLSMEALHALQKIEHVERLPPEIRCAVRRSIDSLQEAVAPFDSVPLNVVM